MCDFCAVVPSLGSCVSRIASLGMSYCVTVYGSAIVCTYLLACICSEYVSVVSLCVSVASFGGYSCVSVIICLSVCMCMCCVFVCLCLCNCALPESGCPLYTSVCLVAAFLGQLESPFQVLAMLGLPSWDRLACFSAE